MLAQTAARVTLGRRVAATILAFAPAPVYRAPHVAPRRPEFATLGRAAPTLSEASRPFCIATSRTETPMAEIILNVDLRDGSRSARRLRDSGVVPGVLYGGDKAPVAISVQERGFQKALHTGQLLGHLVTLKYGEETQPVIAKDVQFHPVTDRPIHFDLFRVDEHARIRIAIPVQFRNHDASPGLKRGGALNINLHEIELIAPADRLPEAVIVDLAGLEIGDSVRADAIPLPEGVEVTAHHRAATVASIAGSSAQQAAEAETAEAAPAA